MKTLYISDMDGTLLDNNSLVSPQSREIISRLSEKGALITVATARTPATVHPLLAGTLTTPPAIVMTGASLWDRKLASMTSTYLITPEHLDWILDVCSREAVTPFVYTTGDGTFIDVFHAPGLSKAEENFVAPRNHLKLKKFHYGNLPASTSDCVLVFALGATDLIERCAETLQKYPDRCSVSFYPDNINNRISLLEIFAPGVSKASAVEALKKQCGASRLVVFGDNLNDLPMMRVADLAVAVDNAFPEVKEAADKVIGPNSAHAVARFIEADYNN